MHTHRAWEPWASHRGAGGERGTGASFHRSYVRTGPAPPPHLHLSITHGEGNTCPHLCDLPPEECTTHTHHIHTTHTPFSHHNKTPCRLFTVPTDSQIPSPPPPPPPPPLHPPLSLSPPEKERGLCCGVVRALLWGGSSTVVGWFEHQVGGLNPACQQPDVEQSPPTAREMNRV